MDYTKFRVAYDTAGDHTETFVVADVLRDAGKEHLLELIVTVNCELCSEYASNNFGLPAKLSDLADWADKMLSNVPDRYREDVKFEFTDHGDEYSHVELRVFYERPECEEERAIRLRNVAIEAWRSAQHHREKDLHMLAALKAKYES